MRCSVLAVAFALTACGGDEREDFDCPAIACGLSVTVTNPPAQAYRVEATAAGQATPMVRNCGSGGSCSIFFVGFSPDQVTIQVILTASGTVERSANAVPTYTSGQIPARCGCRGATVAL